MNRPEQIHYAPGTGLAVVRRSVAVLLPSGDEELALRCHRALDGENPVEDVLALLLGHGLYAAPSFAIACLADASSGAVARFVVRGTHRIVVAAGGQEQTLSEVRGVADRDHTGVEWARLDAGDNSDSDVMGLPLADGVVRAGTILLRPGWAADEAGQAEVAPADEAQSESAATAPGLWMPSAATWAVATTGETSTAPESTTAETQDDEGAPAAGQLDGAATPGAGNDADTGIEAPLAADPESPDEHAQDDGAPIDSGGGGDPWSDNGSPAWVDSDPAEAAVAQSSAFVWGDEEQPSATDGSGDVAEPGTDRGPGVEGESGVDSDSGVDDGEPAVDGGSFGVDDWGVPTPGEPWSAYPDEAGQSDVLEAQASRADQGDVENHEDPEAAEGLESRASVDLVDVPASAETPGPDGGHDAPGPVVTTSGPLPEASGWINLAKPPAEFFTPLGRILRLFAAIPNRAPGERVAVDGWGWSPRAAEGPASPEVQEPASQWRQSEPVHSAFIDSIPAPPAPGRPSFAWDDDVDGETVLRPDPDLDDLDLTVAQVGSAADVPGQMVWAARCPAGHLTFAHQAHCRVCRQVVPPQEPVQMPRPTLGRLVISTGQVVDLDRDVFLGRAPRVPDDYSGPEPHTIRLVDPSVEVSSQHLQVSLDHWIVSVTDLRSTNGTEVVHEDGRRTTLSPDVPVTIDPGTKVILAGTIDLLYEA
ncbi:MAG: hypothetical protein IPH03_02700 [Tetrasphaera sp.]|nr:hypothetical protein [Tetrasphaera sp.]